MYVLEGLSNLLTLPLPTSEIKFRLCRDSLIHTIELFEPHCLQLLKRSGLEINVASLTKPKSFPVFFFLLSPVLISDLETCFFL